MNDSQTPYDRHLQEGEELARRLARRFAKRFAVDRASHNEQWVDEENLAQSGMLGVLTALKKFDPTYGVKFTTFAYPYIRGAILDDISSTTGLPRKLRRKLTKARAIGEVLQDDSSAPVGGVPESDFAWVQRKVMQLSAVLLATEDHDDDPNEIHAPGPGPDEIIQRREAVQRLWEYVGKLPPRQRDLIRLIYQEFHTQTEAAKLLEMDKGWASRLHGRALKQLGRWLGDPPGT